MSLMKDFKDFAMKGNVMDLAIGVIIGAAFGKIVSSLVDDILMPPIGLLIGGVDFAHLSLVLKAAAANPDGTMGEPVLIRYGNFIQVTIQFMIIAFVVFMIVKAMMQMERKKDIAAEAPPAKPQLSTQEKLLIEIRDALTSGKSGK
jgi:large conductance mechanosensitive channel